MNQEFVNKVICDDCMNILPKLASNSVEMVLCDIPYGEVTRPSNGIRNFDKGNADILTFDLNRFLEECDRICYGSFYIWCGSGQLSTIDIYFRNHKITRRLIILEKTNPMPVNGKYIWLSGVEQAVYGKKAGATFNDKFRNTVLRYPCSRNKHHPTEKNLNMFKELIRISSNPGDTILDPCIGGGGTAVAAKAMGRNFIGVDINQEYVDITNGRLNE